MMAAQSSGQSSNHNYESDDNDEVFFPKSTSKAVGLVHLQSSGSSHEITDGRHSYLSSKSDGDGDFFKETYQGHGLNMSSISFPMNQESVSPPYTPDDLRSGRLRQGSIVDGLLHEIYDRWHFGRQDSFDSDTLTECSSTSECFWSGRNEFVGSLEAGYHSSARRQTGTLSRSFLQNKTRSQLERLLADVQRSVAVMSARLVRQLKRRDRRIAKLGRNYDVVTAILQAASLKRQIDTRMRFSIQPPPGESAFDQWKDAMKAVARLPMGIPTEFRKKAWLSLADHYLLQLRINWDKTIRFVFNERSNPDDDKLGVQIVKDLHRTGCSNFSGDDNEEDRAILKRVLLAYARWNKRVGYCQGFNVIAALLLNVMDRKEDDALKVMIYLIDSVLPESYFANNLRALSVDMAVFRDLLAITYPRLSKHLDRLQLAAQDIRTGACYEPPLTNVFTMQWFLTLFATCLPVNIVLRVWDSVLLEGSEILLRTALTIWGRLSKRIMGVSSADEFYCLMGELSSSIMQGAILDGDAMVKSLYALGDFPLPHINELREKYTYNIRPFTPASTSSGKKSGSSRSVIKSMLGSDDDELDDDDITAMACMPGDMNGSASDISVLGPGVYGSGSDPTVVKGTMQMERMSTDINNLKLQYQRLKQRQQQAHIIIAAASAKKTQSVSSAATKNGRQRQRITTTSAAVLLPNIESPTAMNHLFVGKAGKMPSSGRNRLVTDGPRISELPTSRKSGLLAKQLQAVANAQAVSKSQRMRSGSLRTLAASSSSSSSQGQLPTTASNSTSPNPISSNPNSSNSVSPNPSSPAPTTDFPNLDTAQSKSCLQNEHDIADSVQCTEKEHKDVCPDVMCSGDNDKVLSSGDHIDMSHSDTSFPDCLDTETKTNSGDSRELREIDLIASHNVPSLSLSNDNVSMVSNDSVSKENTCCAVDSLKVSTSCVLFPQDPPSSGTMIEDYEKVTTTIPDILQEDSGIESSSTTSPSITPGKRLCHLDRLSSSETLHYNADEEFLLSVETTVIPDVEKTISLSQVECGTSGSVSEQDDVGNGKVLEMTYSCGNEYEHVDCVNDDSFPVESRLDSSIEVPSKQENDIESPGCDNIDNHSFEIAGLDAVLDSEGKSDSFDESSCDINTLLGMVATTSPQRKFIRSMSVAGDSYLPAPSLIDTVSVPETLDVGEGGEGNEIESSARDKPALRETTTLDLKDSTRKTNSSREPVSSKNKLKETKDYDGVSKKSSRYVASGSEQNKSRLSAPSLSYPLTTGSTTHDTSKTPSSKPFNPFPIKLFNANRAKTGLKLGLYTASTLQQLKGLKGKPSPT